MEDALIKGFGAATGLPRQPLERFVREGTPLPATDALLLKWEANSIHDFVFDTLNPSGIRGASCMLSALDDELRQGTVLALQPEQVLFAGGGAGLAVIRQDQKEPALRRLHRCFAEVTRVACCSADTVPLVAGDERFGARVSAAGTAASRARALAGSDVTPPVPFFARRCEVCGSRAASREQPRHGGRIRLECEPCYERIDRGVIEREVGGEEQDYSALVDGLGHLATIYFDGNGIGATIRSLESPLQYRQFSAAIDTTLKETFEEQAARYGLLADHKAARKGTRGRYQRPICGGDDLVVILPGAIAVPFARDLLTTFERKCDAHPGFPGTPIGAAAGVAIGQHTFPMRRLISEAESQMKTMAKRRHYENQADVRSALTFAVVRDGAPRCESEDPARWADNGGVAGQRLLPTGRPYSLTEVERFSRRFNIVKAALHGHGGLGKGQLFTLRRRQQAGPEQLRNHVLYQISRDQEWRALVVELATESDAKLADKALADRALADKEICVDQITPRYGCEKVFDVNDMITLFDHWDDSAAEATA